MRKSPGSAAGKAAFVLVVLLLAANVVMLGYAFEMVGTTAEIDALGAVKRGALVVAQYYDSMAEQAGLAKNQAVRGALAKFRFDIDQAVDETEVAEAISRSGRQAHDVILREEEELDRRAVFSLISSDPRVLAYKGSATVVVTPEAGDVRFQDEKELISPETRERIRETVKERKITSVVQVEIADGKATLLTTRSISGLVDTLRKEVESLRSELNAAMRVGGYSELSGRGITVRGTVREDGEDETGMFGYDVRDIVNELFAAGAQGIEIGGQRLVANSSIRSVGDSLLVNHRPVPTDPVVIKAVGDPEVLESSLDLLINAPYFGLDVSITRESLVTLRAHPR